MIPWRGIFKAIVERHAALNTRTGIAIWIATETVIETTTETVVGGGSVPRTVSMNDRIIVTVIVMAIVIWTANVFATTSKRRDATGKELIIAATTWTFKVLENRILVQSLKKTSEAIFVPQRNKSLSQNILEKCYQKGTKIRTEMNCFSQDLHIYEEGSNAAF